MAVVLATNPKMVLLDEPVAGMGHAEIQVMKNLIEQLKDEGLTFILVEHNMRLVMDICDRIVVLNFGVKLAEGTPREITSNRLVIDAYTGGTENRGHAT
jgi:branched-chain amino acid transport system ATP-binding protein